MKLYINLAEQTTANNLPDKTENKMFSDLNDIAASNIDNRTSNALCRVDNDVIVLGHMKRIKLLYPCAWSVQHSLINGIGHAVVDKLCQHQTILALVEHLKGVRWEGEHVSNIWVPGKHGVDVSGEFGSLIFVDGMRDVRRRALDVDLSADASLGGMSMTAGDMRRGFGGNGRCGTGGLATASQFCYQLYTVSIRCIIPILNRKCRSTMVTDVNVILELDPARAIQFDLLQCLPDNIVRQSL